MASKTVEDTVILLMIYAVLILIKISIVFPMEGQWDTGIVLHTTGCFSFQSIDKQFASIPPNIEKVDCLEINNCLLILSFSLGAVHVSAEFVQAIKLAGPTSADLQASIKSACSGKSRYLIGHPEQLVSDGFRTILRELGQKV